MIDKQTKISIINMSVTAFDIPEAVHRLNHRDPKLKIIALFHQQLTDSKLAELVDCLLANPDIVIHMRLSSNKLTDETGVKLARYIATSSTIVWMDLSHNRFGEVTYLAMAAALCINTSLRNLYLYDNHTVNKNRIDGAFIDAFILNPNRSIHSDWMLYEAQESEFKRLKKRAEELGHPSLQAMLATQLIRAF